MRDWLPQETLLRQKLIRLIEHHYQLYGFQPIDTPVMENIEVLQGKGGGENEKLMFKIMKRGEELKNVIQRSMLILSKRKQQNGLDDNQVNDPGSFPNVAEKANEVREEFFSMLNDDIPDGGLRFDLTVPLARYYANHANDLPKPFRCYHIGPVWRADRPQKGRFREFYQCDIDIIGGASDSYEVELLLATDRILKELKIEKFKIRISDKRLLPTWFNNLGGNWESISKATIAIDKMDKVSLPIVQSEIGTSGLPVKAVSVINSALAGGDFKTNENFLKSSPGYSDELEKIENHIKSIYERIKEINPEANVVYERNLVRGFDYYTGPIFEINTENKDFTSSIGGGGRYDGLVEKLGGPKGTPAVGISLGFERILMILMEKAKATVQAHSPRVFIANNGQPEKDILALAEQLRSEGIQVEASLEGHKKLGQQLEAAQKNGIEYAITEFQPGNKSFKVRQLSTRQDKEMTLAELYDIMKRLSEEIGD